MIRLRENIPLAWVSPTELQVGVEHVWLSTEPTDRAARLLSRMREGVTEADMAHVLGRSEAAAWLASLEPALQEETVPRGRIVVRGEHLFAGELAAVMGQVDAEASTGRVDPGATPLVSVDVTAWELGPADWQRTLQQGFASLPVVIGDATIAIGPLRTGPTTPCWRCARPEALSPIPLAADHASALELPRPLRAIVTGRVTEALTPLLRGGDSTPELIEVDRMTGAVHSRAVSMHSGCPCRGPVELIQAASPKSAKKRDAARGLPEIDSGRVIRMDSFARVTAT